MKIVQFYQQNQLAQAQPATVANRPIDVGNGNIQNALEVEKMNVI
jgi:hypothetical protein